MNKSHAKPGIRRSSAVNSNNFKTMKKIFFIFLSLLFVFTSSADDWKPAEWLLTPPVLIPAPTKEERNARDERTGQKNMYPRSYYKRILNAMPERFEIKSGAKIVTPFGTTKWEKVSADGECPLIKEPVPECSVFFAAKYWISSEDQEADLWYGSSDGVKIWFDGNEIFEYPQARPYFCKLRGFIPVTLKKGTNIFVFAIVNGEGDGMLGARLFPKKSAIYPGLFLDTKNPVETKQFIELDFYWKPAGIVTLRKEVYKNHPKCKKIRLLDFVGNVLTQVVCGGKVGKLESGKVNIPLNSPSKGDFGVLDMRGKSNGIYKIESFWNDKKHVRPFYYAGFSEKLTPTEEWKIELLKNNDFCSPEALLEQTFGKNKTSAKRIRAYKSKYDDTLQPYIVALPKTKKLKEKIPLLVILKPYTGLNKIQFSLKQRYGTSDLLKLWVYSRGDSGFMGLSERDVLEVIELVCKDYKIDRDRIYLQGISLGGFGCWWIGGRHPDLFAGIAANGAYVFTYTKNFLNLPINQSWMKPNNPGNWLPKIIGRLRKEGVDVIYTDLRELSLEKYRQYFTDRENWYLNKKRKSQPDKVVYSTFGDIDGAYWIRNIMPEKFGKMATVEAEVFQTNIHFQSQSTNYGLIHVQTENVSSFNLDLRKSRFSKLKNWEVVIDNLIITNGLSGEMFSYNNTPHPIGHPTHISTSSITEGIRKRNGFCGGIADVVYDSFLFAYSAKDIKARNQAEKFNMAITGIMPCQFDGNFKVVPDTELTSELCEKYNVILFASLEKPGKFLKKNIENLPFKILDGKLEFNHANISTQAQQPLWSPTKHKRDDCSTFACVYPNPIAKNHYLLTVTMTNFTPQLLMIARNDVIFGNHYDSFDVNWNKLQYQDESKSYSREDCDHNHDTKHANHNSRQIPKSEKSLNQKIKEVGGIIFLIILVGIGLFYFTKKK